MSLLVLCCSCAHVSFAAATVLIVARQAACMRTSLRSDDGHPTITTPATIRSPRRIKLVLAVDVMTGSGLTPKPATRQRWRMMVSQKSSAMPGSLRCLVGHSHPHVRLDGLRPPGHAATRGCRPGQEQGRNIPGRKTGSPSFCPPFFCLQNAQVWHKRTHLILPEHDA